MKETVRQRVRQTSLSLVKNSIQAIRRKDICKTGCRLIKDGKISITGGLGKVNEEELFAKAEKFLAEAVEYPVEPGASLSHKTDLSGFRISDAELCDKIENILQQLKTSHPNFYISNKVNLSSIDYSIENELGLNLSHSDTYLSLSFLLKESSSTGIMDTFFGVAQRELDETRVVDAVNQIIEAYQNKLEAIDGEIPVIIDQGTLTRLFLRDLNGKMVGNKASLFDGQFDQQVFSEDFSLRIANDPIETFSPAFDAEGTIANADLLTLIDRGFIRRPYTDKRTARQFGFMNTGCAGGNYDSVPSLGTCMLEIAPSDKTLKQLLQGKMGILVAIASGGDFTPDGMFASPVQVAYLTDGEKLIGRLPEMTISGSIFDFFGKNFVGVSSNKFYCAGDERLAVVNLDVKKL